MLKVGTRWSVQGIRKRSDADVAQELENHMIRAAQSIIEPRSSGTLQAMFAMSGRRAAEPQTEAMGPCMSDASDAKKHDIIMNTTNTKPECSTPELEFQPQRAVGSAAKPLAKRAVRGSKQLRSIRDASSIEAFFRHEQAQCCRASDRAHGPLRRGHQRGE